MSPFSAITAYNLAIVFVIAIGAGLAFLGNRQVKFVTLLVNFSAGVLLGVAFVHMIPESWQVLGPSTGLFILVGYFLIHFMERFFMVHPCDEDHCDFHTMGLAAFFGLSLHSFIGGIALGSASLIKGLGGAVFLATIVHKAPEAFSLTTLLIMGKRKKKDVVAYMGFFAGMVPIGSLIAFVGLPSFGEDVVGGAIAVSAGTFIHIATRDLLPSSHSKGGLKFGASFGFLSGIGLTILTKWIEH